MSRGARLGICLAAILMNLSLTIALALRYADRPWPVGSLAIDGAAYRDGARAMVSAGSWWLSQDTYHSPGYQAFLAFLLRLSGEGSLAELSKCVSIALFVASIAMVFWIGRRLFSEGIGALAAAVFSFSLSWRFYSSMLQYEVLAGFLILGWICLELLPHPRKLLSGAVLVLLVWIQSRYALFLLLPLLYRPKRELPVVRWAAALPVLLGMPLMTGGAFRFSVGNNPNAIGSAFPYPSVTEPSGFEFLWRMPVRFLWLVGRRFLYLWGVLPDAWSLPPPELGSTGWERGLDAFALVIFISGLVFAIRSRRYGVERVFLPVLAIAIPPLVCFGSKRFLVPVMPEIALFQAFGLFMLTRLGRPFNFPVYNKD